MIERAPAPRQQPHLQRDATPGQHRRPLPLLLFLLFVSAAAFLPACWPVGVTAECRARMDTCLRGCLTVEPHPDFQTQEAGVTIPVDTRSACEAKCHGMCAGGASGTPASAKPAEQTWRPSDSDTPSPSPTP